MANNTRKGKVYCEINYAGNPAQNEYVRNVLRGHSRIYFGVLNKLESTSHKFHYRYIRDVGSILNRCYNLAQQGRNNISESLGQYNQSQRLYEVEPLRICRLKLSFGD